MILLITAAIVAAVIIYGHPPGNNKWYPPCIFKKITSFDCPGCGSTRACYHLVHGNILQAANHNLMLVAFIQVMLIGFINFFTGKLAKAWQKLNRPFIILCIILFFWLARNIPLFPFEWLHSDK